MNTEKVRGYLYVAVLLSVLAVGYAAISAAGTYESAVQPSSYRSFTVSADGKATAVPDVAEFTFSVTTQGGKDLASLQTQNTTAMNKAVDFVKSKGVDAKDIQTSNYSISPRYQYCSTAYSSVQPCPPPTIVGYTVSQSADVKIRDFSKIGDILSGVVGSGANDVSSLTFTIDDPTVVQAEARSQAIRKAQAEAQEIAKEGGFSVGRLLTIGTNQNVPQPRYAYNEKSVFGAGVSVSAAAPAPSIEAGSEEVRVSVTLQYEIR